MVFYINPQGVVQTIFYDPVNQGSYIVNQESYTVNQGSVAFNDIIVVTHFSANISILITLPNGIKLPASPLAASNAIGLDGMYAYRVILDKTVTEYPGLLSFSFMLETEGKKLASTVCTLTIGEGAGIDLGSPLDELGDGATNADIIATINQLVENFNTVIDAVSSARDFKDAAESYKDKAEAWAVGTIDGESVSDDAEQHYNNAKYYAEQTQEALNEVREGFVSKKNSVTAQLYGVKNNLQQMFDTGTTVAPNAIPQRTIYGDLLVNTPTSPDGAVPEHWVTSQIATAKAETIEAVQDDIASITDGIEFRLEQLESATLKYTEDSSTAYEKPVPIGSAKYAIIEKVGGMTYKCNNLLKLGNGIAGNYDGVTVTVNDDGSITFDGTLSNDYAFSISLGDIQYDWSSTYTFSLGIDVDGWLFSYYEKYSQEDTDEWEITRELENGSVTFNVASSGCYILPPAGTYNNFTIYPMLNYGDTALPFEPYFEGLRDTKVTSLVSEGANLLPFPYVDSDKTESGVTFKIQPDGGIAVNGTPTAYAGITLARGVPLPPNAGKIKITLQGNSVNCCMDLSLYSSNALVATFSDIGKNGTDLALDTSLYPTAIKYDLALKRWQNSVPVSGVAYPMINYGTTVAPYKPYRGTIDTFPISEPLRTFLEDKGYGRGVEGYPNYIDFERKVFVQNTYRMVFDGNEEWVDLVSGAEYNGDVLHDRIMRINASNLPVAVKTTPSSQVGHILCNDYATTSANAVWLGATGIAISTDDINIYDPNYNTDAVILWKNHLAQLYANGTPIVVEYAMESPDEIDISAYLTEDNIIEVEGGGVIKAVNEYNQAAPTTIEFVSMKGD